MEKLAGKIKWISVSIGVTCLFMVFWVWPAWNQVGQVFFWSSCSPYANSTEMLYFMNRTFPAPGCAGNVSLSANTGAVWMANEAACADVNFGSATWRALLNWVPTGNVTSPIIMWLIEVGTFNEGTGFTEAFNTTETTNGTSLAVNLSPTGNFIVPDLDYVAVRVVPNQSVFLPLGETNSTVVAPPSSPPYPCDPPDIITAVPTLSHWGILIMAVLAAVFSVWALRRRVKFGD